MIPLRITANIVARDEFDIRLAGLAFAKTKPTGKIATAPHQYIDRSINVYESRTTDYSYNARESIYNYQYSFSNKEWRLDFDNKLTGAPNFKAVINTDPTPCDSLGKTIDTYEYETLEDAIIQKDSIDYEMDLYTTHFKTQITIEIDSDKEIHSITYVGFNVMEWAKTETYGDWTCGIDSEKHTFPGARSYYRPVFRVDLKEFISGYDEKYGSSKAAFLNGRITDVYNIMINGKKEDNWKYTTDYSNTKLIPGEIDLYDNAKDCLLKTNEIPYEDKNTIDLDANWVSTVYFGLDTEVLLGTNFQETIVPNSWAQEPVQTGSFMATYDVTFTVATSFIKLLGGDGPLGINVNPYTDSTEGTQDTKFNFLDWLTDTIVGLFKAPDSLTFIQWVFLGIIGLVFFLIIITIAPSIFLPIIRAVGSLFRRIMEAIGDLFTSKR